MNKLLNLAGAISGFLLIGCLSHATAAPTAPSNQGREYLAGTQDLGAWSCGAYYMAQEREVTLWNYVPNQPMRTTKLTAYIGYDVLSWITTYVYGGPSQTRIGHGNAPGSKADFGVGAQFNIFDTEIEDPTFMEDRLRLNGHLQYGHSSARYVDPSVLKEIDWNDFSGSLTVSLVNDTEGDKFFIPDSIAIFVGPAFSFLQSSAIKEKSQVGFVAGMDVFLNSKVSLELSYTCYEKDVLSFGANIRF